MSSPMPLAPYMCSLCFGRIYPGEHWVDVNGQKWDSHQWCDLTDKASVYRRDANGRRRLMGVKLIEDEERQEAELLGRLKDQ